MTIFKIQVSSELIHQNTLRYQHQHPAQHHLAEERLSSGSEFTGAGYVKQHPGHRQGAAQGRRHLRVQREQRIRRGPGQH